MAHDIGAFALEDLMRLHADMHIQIPRRRARTAGLALPGKPDPRAILDTAGDIDTERTLALHGAGPGTDAAWIAHHAPGAAAGRAGPLDNKEPLLRPHLSGAAAPGAGLAAFFL